MKQTSLILAGALTAMLMTSCGPSQSDAIKYNDELIALEKKVTPVQEKFIDQMDGHNADSLKLMYGQFSTEAKSALENCEKMQPFNNKREYLDAVLDYFKTLNSMAENEGKKITEIMSKDSTQITEQDVAAATESAGKFDEKYAGVLKKFQDAQAAFATEYKFKLEEKK
ncbi:MAG: LIC11966 family surface protein [Bacteroidia bacterium]